MYQLNFRYDFSVTYEVSNKLATMSADCGCLAGWNRLPDHNAEELAKIFKALSDPVRLRIYHFIAANPGGSVCTCHMPKVFGITQPTMSYHLKRLVKAGLVKRTKLGKWARFTIEPDTIDYVQNLFNDLLAAQALAAPATAPAGKRRQQV
jgi:hypothetical protein